MLRCVEGNLGRSLARRGSLSSPVYRVPTQTMSRVIPKMSLARAPVRHSTTLKPKVRRCRSLCHVLIRPGGSYRTYRLSYHLRSCRSFDLCIVIRSGPTFKIFLITTHNLVNLCVDLHHLSSRQNTRTSRSPSSLQNRQRSDSISRPA